MGEKDQQDQSVGHEDGKPAESAGKAGNRAREKAAPKSREDRLAEALRANLRRRKAAAKAKDTD